jgi:hypothetical protein
MEYVLAFVIVYPILAVIFGVAVFLYASFIGGVDFGALGQFIIKAAALVAVVTLVLFVPAVGGWIALGVWWAGFVLLFGMEFWEAKVIVIIIWALTFLVRLGLVAALR